MVSRKVKRIAIVAGIAGVLLFAGTITGVLPRFFSTFLKPPGEYHAGVIVFYSEALADDDTTDIDGAGTLEVIDAITLQKRESTLTLGTDTETVKEYGSNDDLWLVWKSTTANAMDHFAYRVLLPFGNYAEGPIGANGIPMWDIQWSSADGYWILTCYGGQEAQPTLLGYDAGGVQWVAGTGGTETYVFSSTINYHHGTLKVKIATNYDALFAFFDPEEGNEGEWDRLILLATQNTTVANQGLFIQGGGWIPCKDANDYYYDLTPHLGTGGMLVRWDEEGQFGLIEVPITFYCNGDLDTSGASDTIVTITFNECSSLEDAYNQNMDSDTLTNLHTAVTQEVVDFAD